MPHFDINPDNLPFIEELYSQFQKNPHDIPPFWKEKFLELNDIKASASRPLLSAEQACPDLRIRNLLNGYRKDGHLYAKVNPISIEKIELPRELALETLGFSPKELSQSFPTLGILPKSEATLQEIIDALQKIYCDKIGIEYLFLEDPELKNWLQEQVESTALRPKLSIEEKKMILQQLNKSELFETFIHTKFTGQKRFSLEGAETLIPMLEEIVEAGSQLGLEQFVIGMAHRGRLNVLSNILRKSYKDIFSEFEEGYVQNSFEGSGDVKYHKGYSSQVTIPSGKMVEIFLPPNPSHLESVNPVVEGMVKARQKLTQDINQEHVLPILIHGDAAITGQGVVYETVEMGHLEGYSTGGTINIVVNNQIGFTAVPSESRSTRYCTDIAHAFNAPVFHVNAEDPEGCIYVTNLAIKIRQKFHCDVFIDLVCYRKYGHNESDEPAYTQPLEYQIIRKKQPIREIYRDQLIHEGVVEKNIAESLEKDFTKSLQEALQESKNFTPATPKSNNHAISSNKIFEVVKTAVSKEELVAIAEKISYVPESFSIHPKLLPLVKDRLSMVSDKATAKPLDWGMAELLAYGSLLWQGTSIRLSGQDCRRGTFSHRHAIWMDQQIEQAYCPLNHLKEDQGKFDVINSHLSEYGVLGFEFGYSCANPKALVLWEAQFGDFSNGAQVMIDQYIATAEQKWGQKFGLVLLLPHGYEGQGPEHSSGRMERFLTLCGNDNMRIANPTTPAQFFHLLRRQMLHPLLKPLIVFTPKGLLRHPACISHLKDLTEGTFQDVLKDSLLEENAKEIKRLTFCSGRIYYDLIAEREKLQITDMAILRIEQLYPLNVEKLEEILKSYKNVEKYCWVQEEPSNMGAWGFIQAPLLELLPTGSQLHYIGRKRSASPAVGSYAVHKQQHSEIMKNLFN